MRLNLAVTRRMVLRLLRCGAPMAPAPLAHLAQHPANKFIASSLLQLWIARSVTPKLAGLAQLPPRKTPCKAMTPS